MWARVGRGRKGSDAPVVPLALASTPNPMLEPLPAPPLSSLLSSGTSSSVGGGSLHGFSLQERQDQTYWIRVARILLGVAYLAIVVLFVVALTFLILNGSTSRHVLAWAVAALFVGIAVPLSLHDIHLHALHYIRPDLQRFYIRILWMVPIYSVESWIALYDRSNKIYFEVWAAAGRAIASGYLDVVMHHTRSGLPTRFRQLSAAAAAGALNFRSPARPTRPTSSTRCSSCCCASWAGGST